MMSSRNLEYIKKKHFKGDNRANFKWKIFSNFVAFSEYPNFNTQIN